MDPSDKSDHSHSGRGSNVSDISSNSSRPKTNDIADGSVKSKEKGTSKFSDSKHATRGKAAQQIRIEDLRQKYLGRNLDEKRKEYRCSAYNTLKDIPTWEEYYPNIKKAARKSRTIQPVKQVDKTLNSKVSLWRGDITTLEIDAIANAANSSLRGGGGVDGAIHSAAGSLLKRECCELHKDGCDTGDAKITAGYKLPAKYVIHTVGPIGEKEKDLQNCYKKCLQHVEENELTAIAFPCISTGIYGYPNEQACEVALKTVREWLEKDGNADSISRVIFCLFLKVDVDLYERYMMKYFPIGDSEGSVEVREQPMDTQSSRENYKHKEQTKKKDTRPSSKSKISDNEEESAAMDTSESNREVKNVPPTGEEHKSEPKTKQDKNTPVQQSDKSRSDNLDKVKTVEKDTSPEKDDAMDTSPDKSEEKKTPKPEDKSASTRSTRRFTAPGEKPTVVETENKVEPSAEAPKSDAEKKKQLKERQKTLGESPNNKKQKSTEKDERCNKPKK